MLGLAVVFVVGAAQVPEAQEAQEVVSTERLVLTNGPDSAAVVLVAGPESSLVIQTPAGEEVLPSLPTYVRHGARKELE